MTLYGRDQFPQLLNNMGLLGEAVEVGTHEGQFSWAILDQWKGKKLYSVDPYIFQPDAKLDASNVSNEEHNAAYQTAKQMLGIYGSRSEIIHDFSVNAAKRFQDNSLDFVYIDARHDYRSTTLDLKSWWRKVKVGGIIAGHDYKNSFVRNNLVEVKRAVRDFFFYPWCDINVTEGDNLPSWYVFK